MNLVSKSWLSFGIGSFFTANAYGFIYLLPLLISSLKMTVDNVGIVLAFAGAGMLLMSLFSSYVTNRHGPQTTAIIGNMLLVLGFLLVSFSGYARGLLYIAGMFIGGGWSFFYAALPMIILRMFGPLHCTRYFAYIAAVVVLGGGIGPILGHFLIKIGFSEARLFIAPIILCLIALPFLMYQMRIKILETMPAKKNSLGLSKMLRVLSTSKVKYIFLMIFIGACIFSTLMNFQVIYAQKNNLNFSTYYSSYMIAVVSSRFLFGSVLEKRSGMDVVFGLLVIMMVGLMILVINTTSSVLYSLGALCIGVGYGLVYPLIKAWAFKNSDAYLHSQIAAYIAFCYFLAVYLFPLFAGLIIKFYGITILFYFLIAITVIDAMIALSLFFYECRNV